MYDIRIYVHACGLYGVITWWMYVDSMKVLQMKFTLDFLFSAKVKKSPLNGSFHRPTLPLPLSQFLLAPTTHYRFLLAQKRMHRWILHNSG